MVNQARVLINRILRCSTLYGTLDRMQHAPYYITTEEHMRKLRFTPKLRSQFHASLAMAMLSL